VDPSPLAVLECLRLMEIPIKFPTPREKLAQEVEDYRGASLDERIAALLDLSDLCESFLASSEVSEKQLQLLDANEEAEHRAWKDLVAKYVGG